MNELLPLWKMKRALAIIMLCFYSLAVMGMPLHYHYCKGDLVHVSLITQRTCDTHEVEVASPFACCMSSSADHCSQDQSSASDCCDNESEWSHFR